MPDEHLQPAGGDVAVVRAFVRAVAEPAVDAHAWVGLLANALPTHFAAEEAPGGLFDSLEARGASVLLVERLRADHRELVDALAHLELSLARGLDARAELLRFAERVREHEWIEGITAAQRGTPYKTAPMELTEAGQALEAEVAAALDAVADRSRAMAEESSIGDLLAAISVAVPAHAPLDGIRSRLEHGLAARGLDFVDVATCASPDGQVHLCGARFRRPRVGTYLRSNFSIR